MYKNNILFLTQLESLKIALSHVRAENIRLKGKHLKVSSIYLPILDLIVQALDGTELQYSQKYRKHNETNT